MFKFQKDVRKTTSVTPKKWLHSALSTCNGKAKYAFKIGINEFKLMSVKPYSSCLTIALFPHNLL
jgi:hypothetical protein